MRGGVEGGGGGLDGIGGGEWGAERKDVVDADGWMGEICKVGGWAKSVAVPSDWEGCRP